MKRYRLIAIGMAAVMTARSIMTCAAMAADTGKEEVVYVMTDAAGNVSSVNVVNIFGSGQVTDYGNYSSVKMLTSADAIEYKDGKVDFTTSNDRVYYQGTMTDADIPWIIGITYSLDGKEISAGELAGRDGALDIHITTKANPDCAGNFFDNYALQASVTLDTELCGNITADNATVANVGSDKQITYTVLPGKNLDAHITADVHDFEMDAIAVNGVKLNLDIEIDDEELMDKVREITDAAAKIDDGAVEVKDGAGQLGDGAGELADGSDKLYSGIVKLNSGASELNDKAAELKTAIEKLNESSSGLTGGSKEMLAALQSVQTELDKVSLSTDRLKTLTDSSAAIRTAIDNLCAGCADLDAKISYQAYKDTMKAGGLDLDMLALKNDPVLNAVIYGTQNYFDAVSAGADSLLNGLKELKNKYSEFDKAITEMSAELGNVTVNMAALKTAITEMVVKYEQLDTGVSDYTDGVAQVLAAYSLLCDGVGTIADGSSDLKDGAGDLKSGTLELCNGIDELYDGTVSLADGTGEFREQTADMDEQVSSEIDDMLDSISGAGEVSSFVSDKNTDIKSVQFVIKTEAVKKTEVEPVVEEKTEKLNFWQKFLKLFGL